MAEALAKVAALLAEHLGVEARQISLRHGSGGKAPDALAAVPGRTFALKIRLQATAESILSGAYQLKHYSGNTGAPVVPLLIVPFMGEMGAALCRREGLSWMDLSGNAAIRAPGLVVHVAGRPNQYQRKGRPQSLFAAQNSRLARWLLQHPDSAFTHSELVGHTRLDPGYTTRILRRMAAEGYVKRAADKTFSLADGPRLLQDWYRSASFSKHQVHAGSCYASSGPMLLRELAAQLGGLGMTYAFTGLAAAWLYTKHVSFNLATVYVGTAIDQRLRDQLGFHADARGANVWLVRPSDAGVFDGARLIDGAACVHPVQAYVDLNDQPERAEEAAAELLARSEFARLRDG